MPEQIKQIYVFDDFYLAAAACQLQRLGKVIPLPPKVFDVLLVLTASSALLGRPKEKRWSANAVFISMTSF